MKFQLKFFIIGSNLLWNTGISIDCVKFRYIVLSVTKGVTILGMFQSYFDFWFGFPSWHNWRLVFWSVVATSWSTFASIKLKATIYNNIVSISWFTVLWWGLVAEIFLFPLGLGNWAPPLGFCCELTGSKSQCLFQELLNGQIKP